MKFLHCADIHLDSPLRGLARYEGAPVDEIRGATRSAFENVIDLAVEESVSAVVIAGDMYDGNRDDFNTAMFLQRRFGRLRDEGIPVVIVYGNHDAANEITRRLRPPDNVTVLPHDHAATVELADAGIAFHGQSYATKAVDHDLSAHYPAPRSGLLNVGVLHTSLAGHEGPHARYAPCTETALADHGYQYWALGHVHERYETRRDGSWIVYPGNVQGRHARELGPKGATLVSYDADQVTAVEHRTLDTVRWARCEVDATDVGDPDELTNRGNDALRVLADDADGRLLAARVVFTGATAAADELLRYRPTWEAQLRADAAGAGGRVWIEKVELGTTRPAEAPPTEAGDAIDAIRAAVESARHDPAMRAELAAAFTGLQAKLGADLPDLRELGLPALDEQGVAALLPDVEALLLARLQGTGS